MLARFGNSSKKLSSLPQSGTQDSKKDSVSLRDDSVNQGTTDQYFSMFSFQHDILKGVSEILLSHYKEIFSFVNLLEKDEDFFLKTICSSCMTNFFYDLRFFMYNLNILVNSPISKLDIPHLVISKDTLCHSCITLVLHYENFDESVLHRTNTTMPSWQTVVYNDSHSTTTVANAASEQQDRSINDYMLFISEQMDFVLSVTGQIHAILSRLQQGKADYKELLEKSTDLVVLRNKHNVELKIRTLGIFLKHTLNELIKCRGVFNVILLCNKDKQAELLDRELKICQNDSNLRLVRVLILNRILSRESYRARLFGERNITCLTQRVFNAKEQIDNDAVGMSIMSDVRHVKSEECNADAFADDSDNGGDLKETTDQPIQSNPVYDIPLTAANQDVKADAMEFSKTCAFDDDSVEEDQYCVVLDDNEENGADMHHYCEIECESSEAYTVMASVGETHQPSGSKYGNDPAMQDYFNIDCKASKLDETAPTFTSSPKDMLCDTLSSSSTKRNGILDYEFICEESGESGEEYPVMAGVSGTRQDIPSSSKCDSDTAMHGYYNIERKASTLGRTTPTFSSIKDTLSSVRRSNSTKRDRIPDRSNLFFRGKLSDASRSIVQYMESEEGRKRLLDSLVKEAGNMNQLVKILAAELGKEALVNIFNMSLSYVEQVLSNDDTNVIHKRIDGKFVRSCGGGALLKMQLLEEFISYVNAKSNKKVGESASSKGLFDRKSYKYIGYDTVRTSKVKDGSSVSRSYSDAKLMEAKQYVEKGLGCRNTNAGSSAGLSSTLSNQNKKFVSFNAVDCIDVSNPSSSKQDLMFQAFSNCQSDKQDVSAENLPMISSCMGKSVALVDQYAVHANKVLENFIKDMIDGLNKSIDRYLRFTDKLQKEPNLLNWVLYFLINKNSFSACKSAILEGLKPCFLYYNLIASIPDLDLYVKKLDTSWIDSYVKSLYTLVHKCEVNGVNFGVSKDCVIRKLSKYQMQVYDVKRLSHYFEVFNSTNFDKQNLSSFVIKNKVIISLKYFKTNEVCYELDGSCYYGMIIKGDISKKVVLTCNNLTLHGNIKGKVVSSCRESVKIVGSVTGCLISEEESATGSTAVSVDNCVQDRSAVKVERNPIIQHRGVSGVVEVCGNVSGTVIVRNRNIIINGKVSNKGSVISKFGKYACFVGTVAGSVILKRTKFAFFNDILYSTTHLIAEECKICLRKEKKLQLDLGFIDSEFFELSESFKFDVSKLKKIMDEDKRTANDDGAGVSTRPEGSKSNIIRSKNVRSFFRNVRINSMSELMAI
ncbi:hypothetical protein DRF75_03510 [Ehrlichia minasensis]|uniref:Uncharacterized protein n=1 Tax=Ehrlichia minasensis TaxID=1242993 RepID=A0A4Q6I3X8_9RICK|nr:hypothetical protein [Ehrlichia minasensis]RZB12562.1 hypothetical protein DRF75_03510 [Ehrlichia minasensis]CEI84864.1 Uncharacterized protein ehr_00232 [Ehrlichia minasensis]